MWSGRIARGTTALILLALMALCASAGVASAAGRRGLAKRLLARDPGALVGGNTIVGTADGQKILGVPDRPNYIIGLGAGETIVGGRGADQLGARGGGSTIRGGPGNDLIHGSPRRDTIYGGAGDDLIINRKGAATIYTGPGHDRVLCAPGSVDRVHATRGDSLAPSCRRAHAAPAAAGRPRAGRDPNGCTDNPATNCEFEAAAGSLPPSLWSNQKTPQRQCPADHQYLIFQEYVPFGTNAPFGVELVNIGNVGFFAPRLVRSDDYVVGTQVGSVTNWTFSSQSWEMWFHCTSDKSQGWTHN